MFNMTGKNGKQYIFKVSSTGKGYQFDSVGPKGTISKIVRFDELSPGFYNIALGDQASGDKEVDFEINSNNDDILTVLDTVAAIIEHFSLSHPGAVIHLTGSENKRTRIYQWRLKRYLQSSELKFIFLGQKGELGPWEPFEESENYTAFLVVPVQ